MSVTVAVLRGINVGGRHSLPMAELRALLERLGAIAPRTYIQSGNAVFGGTVSPRAISGGIEAQMGFRPHVLCLSLTEYEAILADCPYGAEGDADGKTVHVWFTDGVPGPLGPDVTELAGPSEAVKLTDGAAYLLAPEGIGRSKLAARMDRALGVPATARNWRTCCAIRDMARAL